MLFDTSHPGFAAAFLLAGAIPFTAQAEGLRYSVSLYTGESTSPFARDNTDTFAAPDFLIEGDSFSFGTSGLTWDMVETERLTLSARLAPRFVTHDPADTAGLEHLKRDIAIEAGLAASLSLGEIQVAVEALKDVSGTHDGMSVSATVGTRVELTDRFGIGARAGATWMDQKLATYSYGVLPSETRGALAAYQVQDSVIPMVGIEATFALTDNATLVGGATVEFLPDSVTASPIVKRDSVASAMVGLRYAF